jgi:hypothetical protein
MQEANNRAFFSKLGSHFEACQMIKDASNALFTIAVLQAITALIQAQFLTWIDVGVNTMAAFLIRRYHSRAAAIMALGLAILTFALFMIAKVNGESPVGSTGLIFALLALWAGARATEATFKLHGSLSAIPKAQNKIEILKIKH